MNSSLLFVILNGIFSFVGIMAVVGDDYVLMLVSFFVVLIISVFFVVGVILGVIRLEMRHEMRLGKKTGPQPVYLEKQEQGLEKKFVGFFPMVMPPLDFTKEKNALRESFNEQERLIVSSVAATKNAFEEVLNENTRAIYIATHIRCMKNVEKLEQWRIYFSDGYFTGRQFADMLEAKLRNRSEPLLLVLNGCTSLQIANLLRSNLTIVAISEPVSDRHASDFGDVLIKRLSNNTLSKAIGLAVAWSKDPIADMVRVEGVDWKEWTF